MMQRMRPGCWLPLELSVAFMLAMRSWDAVPSASLFGGGMGMGEATWLAGILEDGRWSLCGVGEELGERLQW